MSFLHNLIFLLFFFSPRVNEKSPVTELSLALWERVCRRINCVLCAVWMCIPSAHTHTHTHTQTHTLSACWFINTTAVDQVLPTESALISKECKSTCFWTDGFQTNVFIVTVLPQHHGCVPPLPPLFPVNSMQIAGPCLLHFAEKAS